MEQVARPLGVGNALPVLERARASRTARSASSGVAWLTRPTTCDGFSRIAAFEHVVRKDLLAADDQRISTPQACAHLVERRLECLHVGFQR